MPSASGTRRDPPTALSAEQAHLRRCRDFLRLMREDVLALRALAGDPVSEQSLRADLHRRAESLRDLPDTPLFFGRLDYSAADGPAVDGDAVDGDAGEGVAGHRFHVGRRHIHDPDGHPVVIDWRAPVSRPFYRASPADPMGLELRRRFGFSGGELTAHEDEVLTGGPGADSRGPESRGPGTGGTAPEPGVSRILIEENERPRSGPMRDIVATIAPDQDDIVRAGPERTLCVQGAPGTGKTAVGLHRIAYLLYAFPARMT